MNWAREMYGKMTGGVNETSGYPCYARDGGGNVRSNDKRNISYLCIVQSMLSMHPRALFDCLVKVSADRVGL